MPHYKLVRSGRPEVTADEIVLARHDETGEVKHSLGRDAREIPEELLSEARKLAARMGMRVVEVSAPEGEELRLRPSDEDVRQPVGADTAGAAPVVSQTGDSGAEIDQQATARQGARASQQGSDVASADASTTQSGTPGSSATTTAPAATPDANTGSTGSATPSPTNT